MNLLVEPNTQPNSEQMLPRFNDSKNMGVERLASFGMNFLRHPMMAVVDEANDRLIVSDHDEVVFFDSFPPYSIRQRVKPQQPFFGPVSTSMYMLGMVLDQETDSLIAVDHTHNRVLRISRDGRTIMRLFDKSDGEPKPGYEGRGTFCFPVSIIIDDRGRRWVTDRDHNCVQAFDRDFNFLFSVGSMGSGSDQLRSPTGIALDPVLHRIYVSDTNNRRIQAICTDTGRFLFSFGKSIPKDGAVSGNIDGQLTSPRGIAVDCSGNVWVADYSTHRVLAFDSDGEYITSLERDKSNEKQFQFPYGVAVDRRDGRLFVVDSNHRRIHAFSPLVPVMWNRSEHVRCPPAFREAIFQLMAVHHFAERLAEEALIRGGDSDVRDCYNIMAFASLPRELLAILFDLLLVSRSWRCYTKPPTNKKTCGV